MAPRLSLSQSCYLRLQPDLPWPSDQYSTSHRFFSTPLWLGQLLVDMQVKMTIHSADVCRAPSMYQALFSVLRAVCFRGATDSGRPLVLASGGLSHSRHSPSTPNRPLSPTDWRGGWLLGNPLPRSHTFLPPQDTDFSEPSPSFICLFF